MATPGGSASRLHYFKKLFPIEPKKRFKLGLWLHCHNFPILHPDFLEQAEKLKRYFINADPFLWGVLENKNKKGRLQELRKLGFFMGYSEGSNPTYSKVNRDLLVELGIDGILERIVVPKVTNGFALEVLRYLRRCWEQGQTPDMKYLKERKLYRKHIFAEDKVYDGREPRIVGHKDTAHLFVQIDTQHNFVERWTVFAGLWFEEIEPLSGSVREDISEAGE